MISGIIVSQIAAYGIIALLLIRVMIPELKALGKSPFRAHGFKLATRNKYLVRYLVFKFISLMPWVLAPFDLSFLFLIGRIFILFNLMAFVTLLMWIFDFTRKGKAGLFREIYLSGSRVQEAILPFMWILFAIVAGVNLIGYFAAAFRAWVAGHFESGVFPFMLAAIIPYCFAILSFFFYANFKDFRAHVIILYLLGIWGVYIAITKGLGALFSPDAGFLGAPAPTPWEHGFLSNPPSAIATTLIGWFFYHRLVKTEPGPWIEKTG